VKCGWEHAQEDGIHQTTGFQEIVVGGLQEGCVCQLDGIQWSLKPYIGLAIALLQVIGFTSIAAVIATIHF
jgi:hypothetical protein